MEAKKWVTLQTDENTGRRVLVWTNIINGLQVDESDLGDSDAMRELNDY